MGRKIIDASSVHPRAGMPGGPYLACSFFEIYREWAQATDFRVPEAPSFWQAPRSGVLVVQRKMDPATSRMEPRELVRIEADPHDVVRFAPLGEGMVDLAVRRHRDGLVLPLGRVSLDDENLDPGVPDDPTDDLSAICPECEHSYESSLALAKPCPECNWSPIS